MDNIKPSDKSKNTIIDDHRNMLSVSKNISIFQEQNLKKWPYIVFDNISKCNIKYNFISKEEEFYEGIVEFDFIFKNNESPSEIIKTRGLNSLKEWTQSLFWSNTHVVFKIKGEEWT
jgi:hypothetical protein